jgi:hypothetical protein
MGKELFEDLARFIYQIITRKKSSRSWISWTLTGFLTSRGFIPPV